MTLLLKKLRSASDQCVSVPCFLTLLNACFGFLAVLAATEYQYGAAALCIVCAAVMDVLDGRIARALHAASPFGTELDSLSDAVSFCLAPAIMFFYWYKEYDPVCGVLIACIYLVAGLLRLARFNVFDAHNACVSRGLPTTAAALIVSSLIVLFPSHRMAHYWVGFGMIALAALMVSSIQFPLLKRFNLVLLIPIFMMVLIAVSSSFYELVFC